MDKRNLAITAFAVSTALFSATSASAETNATDEKDILITSAEDTLGDPPIFQPGACDIDIADTAEYRGPSRDNQVLHLHDPIEFEIDGELLTKISIEHVETEMSFPDFDGGAAEDSKNPEINNYSVVFLGDQLELSPFEISILSSSPGIRLGETRTDSTNRNVQMIELPKLTASMKFVSDLELLTNHSDYKFHQRAVYKTHLKVKCYTN